MNLINPESANDDVMNGSRDLSPGVMVTSLGELDVSHALGNNQQVLAAELA